MTYNRTEWWRQAEDEHHKQEYEKAAVSYLRSAFEIIADEGFEDPSYNRRVSIVYPALLSSLESAVRCGDEAKITKTHALSVSLMEFLNSSIGEKRDEGIQAYNAMTREWIGDCHFIAGNWKRARKKYEETLELYKDIDREELVRWSTEPEIDWILSAISRNLEFRGEEPPSIQKFKSRNEPVSRVKFKTKIVDKLRDNEDLRG